MPSRQASKRKSAAPSTAEPTLIKSQASLEALCAQIKEAGLFGFDTEFVTEDCYESEVCLVQVSTEREVAIIDPFLEVDLGPIWELVIDENVETVLHAGMEDLALCVQHTGKAPRNIFDIQVIAGLISHDYPLSLQKLIRAMLGVRLHKSKTLTDWRKRPLTDAQIHYAAEDVNHLLPARQKIKGRLSRNRRQNWAKEELQKFEEITLYRRVEEERLLRLKGTASMDGKQLAVTQALMNLREELAETLNRPARVVLRDHLLVEIARHCFTKPEEVRELRGINLNGRHITALCKMVADTLKTPPEQWPTPANNRHVESPEETALVALTTSVIRSYCAEHRIAYSLAATKKSIGQLVRFCIGELEVKRAEVDLLRGWRGKTVGKIGEEVLTGKRHLSVQQLDGKHRIHLDEGSAES